MKLFGLISLIFCAISVTAISEKEVTIVVKPRTSECFFVNLEENDEIEFEYQVTNSNYGELDIDFTFFSMDGSLLKHDTKVEESEHAMTIEQQGEYKFCFDNNFSRVSSKTVYFSYVVSNPERDQDEELARYESKYVVEDVSTYAISIDQIKNTLDRIKSHVTKTRFMQMGQKAQESKDRHQAENNFERVNMFSTLSVGVMIVTGLVQVYLLRSLFDDRNKLHKLWKHIK